MRHFDFTPLMRSTIGFDRIGADDRRTLSASCRLARPRVQDVVVAGAFVNEESLVVAAGGHGSVHEGEGAQ